ncbi:MAG: RNA-directed polymerase [Euryarchaeota archaeon]|nr:RNA-directed polymerase [Euryarchaeota archaeon]
MKHSIICDEKQFKEFMDSIQPPISKEEYDIQYESFLRLVEKELPYIYDLNHLSFLVGESKEQLDFFIRNKRKVYVSYKMKKKRGGYRTIDAPSKKLKFVQRWILQNILYIIKVSKHSHGFIPGRSIATNAKIHVGQELVMGIDLKDFFPSIKFNRVSGFFKSVWYNNNISTILAELCTFNWQLPQGAPTSPMISNLIASRLDRRLAGFCKKKELLYSRYADDITISGWKVLPRYKTLIFRIITEEGFEINYEKVRIQGRGSCQLVTGLVVNDKVSIGRKKKRTIKSLVHKISENGSIEANETGNPFFKEMVYGLLSFTNVVEPEFAQPLIEKINLIDWKEFNETYAPSQKSELIERSFKRCPTIKRVLFNDLGFFKGIKLIPQNELTKEFLKELSLLKEKCSEHKKENCQDCLIIEEISDETCMKYILGHYIGSTGGAHHGHEVYDVGEITEYENKEVFVAFLMKSKDDTNSKNSLFTQFFDCTENEGIDIISVVSTEDLDHKTVLRLQRVMKQFSKGHLYCLILRKEMASILYSFKKEFSKSDREKSLFHDGDQSSLLI